MILGGKGRPVSSRFVTEGRAPRPRGWGSVHEPIASNGCRGLRISRLGPLRVGLGLLDRIRTLIDVRGQIALQHLFLFGLVETELSSEGLGTVLFCDIAILWGDPVWVGQFLLLGKSSDR